MLCSSFPGLQSGHYISESYNTMARASLVLTFRFCHPAFVILHIMLVLPTGPPQFQCCTKTCSKHPGSMTALALLRDQARLVHFALLCVGSHNDLLKIEEHFFLQSCLAASFLFQSSGLQDEIQNNHTQLLNLTMDTREIPKPLEVLLLILGFPVFLPPQHIYLWLSLSHNVHNLSSSILPLGNSLS